MIFVTVPTADVGRTIARRLVDQQLAACVNLIPSVESIYRWKGERCEESELLLVVKTRAELFERVSVEIKAYHSYTVPEVIALPIVEGSSDYLRWIQESTVVSGGV